VFNLTLSRSATLFVLATLLMVFSTGLFNPSRTSATHLHNINSTVSISVCSAACMAPQRDNKSLSQELKQNQTKPEVLEAANPPNISIDIHDFKPAQKYEHLRSDKVPIYIRFAAFLS